eukprot:Platyproteum_vivax@DN14070_c0_g1_i1.p1
MSLLTPSSLKLNIKHQLFREDSASVYSATFVSEPSVEVAVKLSTASTAEIEHEALILYNAINRLKSKRLLKIWALVVVDKQRTLVSDRCQGPNLIDYIIRSYPKGMPEAKARKISRDMFEGIAALHAAGISHRDVKLDNLMFLDRECTTTVLIDFDSAASFDSTKLRTPRTVSRSAGTLEYMAPECADDFSICTPNRDLWAAGVVLYGLVSGTFPFFPRKHNSSLKGDGLRKVLNHPVKLRSHFTPELKNLLEGLLRVEPKYRFNISEVLRHHWFTAPPPAAEEPGEA